MLHQQQKVKWAVLNAPFLIDKYKEPPYNKHITNSVLNKMLNRSYGIEFECFGSLYNAFGCFNDKYSRHAEMVLISEYYGLQAYHEDSPNCADDPEVYNEHQVRIKNYSQLMGLYEVLNDMKKYCQINPLSGIHIHVDIEDVFLNLSSQEVERHFQTYLEPKFDEIEQIFYPGDHYTGEYNSRHTIRLDGGSRWVSIRNTYKSLEFRIAPMTFDYNTLVTWLVKLNALVSWCILQNPELAKDCNVRHKNKPAVKLVVKKRKKRVHNSNKDESSAIPNRSWRITTGGGLVYTISEADFHAVIH